MLQNQTIIITGAGDGLGKALSLKYIELGAFVIGIGKTESKLKIIEAQFPTQFRGYVCDLSNRISLDSTYDQILSEYPMIDILVNNAAIWFEGEHSSHSLEILEKLVMTNIFSVMGSIAKIYPTMIARKSGQILNINSTAGVDVCKDWSPYSGTKYAITGYTKGLYEEAATHGIKVMQLHPGGMDTNIFESYQEGYGKHDWMMQKEKIVDIIISMLTQPSDMIIESCIVRKIGKI